MIGAPRDRSRATGKTELMRNRELDCTGGSRPARYKAPLKSAYEKLACANIRVESPKKRQRTLPEILSYQVSSLFVSEAKQ
jgi:hypothetical protein